jgi:hypothetical protein
LAGSDIGQIRFLRCVNSSRYWKKNRSGSYNRTPTLI